MAFKKMRLMRKPLSYEEDPRYVLLQPENVWIKRFTHCMGLKCQNMVFEGKYCSKECKIETAEIRRKNLKRNLNIAYLGGKCKKCGSKTRLHFHHLDPENKDYNISERYDVYLPEDNKEELDKCILLCRKCHKLVHNTNDLRFFEKQTKTPKYTDL